MSVLDFQLVSFSSVGRGQLVLKDFEDQRKRTESFPVFNSANKSIGSLVMTVQYLYSFRQIYSDELARTQAQLREGEQVVRTSQATIDSLFQIFPSDERPDLNWDSILRIKKMVERRDNSGEGNWRFICLAFALALVAVNLLFAIVEPNMVELTGCLVLIIDLMVDEKVDLFLPAMVTIGALVAKDFLYMFVYRWTDYTALSGKLEGGEILLDVVRWGHVFALVLKALLAGALWVLRSKVVD